MGVVFLATDTQLGRKVALKIPTRLAHDREDILRRFYREAKAAAVLDHPNICSVYDVDQVDGTHYIAMQYIEGKPLTNYFGPNRPMDERKAALVVRKLAQALGHAHSRGIIHRDLKPANVMIGKNHEPMLTDFGLARQINNTESVRMTHSGTLLGTPAYMSPEQVEGNIQTIGPASDIYSLGVIFYELLTGRIPFQGQMAAVLAQIVSKDPDPPSSLRPQLDRRLESICLRMMSKPIGKRFASMDEVANALTDVLKTPAERKSDADVSVRSTNPAALQVTVLTTGDAQALYRTARKCVQAHDYEQAVRLLEQIPDRFCDPEIDELLEEATARHDEVQYLVAALEDAASRNDYTGLLPIAERLLELKPGHRKAFAVYKQSSTPKYKSASYRSRTTSLKTSGEPRICQMARCRRRHSILVAAIIFVVIYATTQRHVPEQARKMRRLWERRIKLRGPNPIPPKPLLARCTVWRSRREEGSTAVGQVS